MLRKEATTSRANVWFYELRVLGDKSSVCCNVNAETFVPQPISPAVCFIVTSVMTSLLVMDVLLPYTAVRWGLHPGLRKRKSKLTMPGITLMLSFAITSSSCAFNGLGTPN